VSALRVVLADDHPVVLGGVERFCEAEPDLEVVAAVSSIDALHAALERSRADVVSLDVQLPGMEGPRTVEAIAAHGAPVLLFTLHPVDAAIAALVQAGARGYVSKSRSLVEYADALRAVAAGERHLPDELAPLLDAPARPGPRELLTPRELEVFEQLVGGATVKEAAFELGLSASTVYTHLDRIRAKVGVRTQAELVRYAASWDLDPG